MNPEDRLLLERSLKLAKENNQILRRMQRAARWALVWGFIKAVIIIIPLVIGYLYLEPYLDQAIDNYQSVRELLNF
jgi:hypothetical protein